MSEEQEQALATVEATVETANWTQTLTLTEFRAKFLPDEFLSTYMPGAQTDGEIALAFEQMRQTKLNPYFRQIYFISRWDKKLNRHRLVAQTGIDGYRLIAERTGLRDGEEAPQWCGKDGKWRDSWSDSAPPIACRVGVYRKGSSRAFWGVAHFREYVGDTPLWRKMPAQMLAKCAEALAIRKAFPQETCGIYAEEEMDQLDHPVKGKSQSQTAEATATVAQPEAAGTEHPLRAKLLELMAARLGDDKQAKAQWLKAQTGRSWNQLTVGDLAHLVEALLEPVSATEGDQAEAGMTEAEATVADTPETGPTEAPDPRRKKLQQRWAMLRKDKGLESDTAYWWAQEQFGWVFCDKKGRSSANLTPILQVEAAVKTLQSLGESEVERIRQDHAYWLDAQRLAGEASDG